MLGTQTFAVTVGMSHRCKTNSLHGSSASWSQFQETSAFGQVFGTGSEMRMKIMLPITTENNRVAVLGGEHMGICVGG